MNAVKVQHIYDYIQYYKPKLAHCTDVPGTGMDTWKKTFYYFKLHVLMYQHL